MKSEPSTEIDSKIYDLYDEYCHSDMERREFLRRASAIAVLGGSSTYDTSIAEDRQHEQQQ